MARSRYLATRVVWGRDICGWVFEREEGLRVGLGVSQGEVGKDI